MKAYIECAKCSGQYILKNVNGIVMCPKCKRNGGRYKIAMGSDNMEVPDWFVNKSGASALTMLQVKKAP